MQDMKELYSLKIQKKNLNNKQKNLNNKQKNLMSVINQCIELEKFSYTEIKKVLYLIDREQKYLANNRASIKT
ncbi:TPA: hypothetical protein ACHCLU_000440 [Staphylococcus aureus]